MNLEEKVLKLEERVVQLNKIAEAARWLLWSHSNYDLNDKDLYAALKEAGFKPLTNNDANDKIIQRLKEMET